MTFEINEQLETLLWQDFKNYSDGVPASELDQYLRHEPAHTYGVNYYDESFQEIIPEPQGNYIRYLGWMNKEGFPEGTGMIEWKNMNMCGTFIDGCANDPHMVVAIGDGRYMCSVIDTILIERIKFI